MAPLAVAAAIELARAYAPRVVRHLTGSDAAADVAERVVDVAQAITGTATPDAAAAALQADPQAVLRFQEAMAGIDADLERAYLADRQNARERDVEFLRAGRTNTRANVMLVAAFMAVIAIAAVLGFSDVDSGDAAAGFLMAVGGMFARNIGTAFDFEFGSSRGSRLKDELAARSAPR